MRSTMQDSPLSISRILTHGATVHARAEVSTWTGDGARTVTFADVGRDAARLANALRSIGVDGDKRVATFMFNNTEHLTAYLAVPSMGAVLHTLNVRLPYEQVSWIANHAQDHVLIVDGSLVPALAPMLKKFETVRHIILVGKEAAPLIAGPVMKVHRWDDLLASQSDEFEWPDVDEFDAAALCYTSGTTGDPKGVAYSHRSIYLHSMQIGMAESFNLSDRDLALVVVPQFHAMAWGLPYAAFMTGASMLMPDRFLQAEPLARMTAQLRPTFAGAVPTVWTDLLAYADENKPDLSSLREVVVGGSAAPPSLMQGYFDRHGVRIIHAWGMTETSPLGSVARPPVYASPGDEEWAFRITQGRLPASVEGRLVGDGDVVLPNDGVAVGELEVRGPWITGSYYDDESEEAQAKFHDGWLRTGDVGTLSPDGYLTLTDRSKDVIKSGGEWISSVELENTLMGHPAVREAAVVGVPDERWGERPLALVVWADPDSTVDYAELRAFVGTSIAKWQTPERWVAVEAVPKTSVGKFDKKVIRAQYADGVLDVVTLERVAE